MFGRATFLSGAFIKDMWTWTIVADGGCILSNRPVTEMAVASELQKSSTYLGGKDCT
jgi:hypothetical protein